MDEISAIEKTRPGALARADDLADAEAFARGSKAASTRRAYEADWRDFAAYCERSGAEPFAPAATAAYLAHCAKRRLKASTIDRRAAAIAYSFRLHGRPAPTEHEAVRATLSGIRRELGTRPEQKAPATIERVAKMARKIPVTTAKGLRDLALLLLGFVAGTRRSELVGLDVADLEFTPEGVFLHIRRSKTDQAGRGREVAVIDGKKIKAVQALKAWLAHARITSGPVFRGIDRHGNVSAERLTPQSVALVVKDYAGRAGLDASLFAGHSLRAGFATSAAEAGVDPLAIAGQLGHADLKTTQRYIRRAKSMKQHPGRGFL